MNTIFNIGLEMAREIVKYNFEVVLQVLSTELLDVPFRETVILE